MSQPPLVVIGAGGTGGHMFPASAFAAEMKARNWRVGLLTDDRGLKYTDGFPADWIETIQAANFASKRPDKLISSGLKIMSGMRNARRKMVSEGAVLAAGFGGYPAFPALGAAQRLGIPIVIHEQNAVLGRVNRQFAGAASIMASAFERLERLPEAAKSKWHVVGNPVRSDIVAIHGADYPPIGDSDPIKLLVTGGSQGARLFGETIPPACVALPEAIRTRLQITQQVREEQVDGVKALYAEAGIQTVIQPFFSDMPERLTQAHLVIARAGASSVTELSIAGRPGVLIPLAIAMDDHQTGNAEALAQAGGADIVQERDLSVDGLTELLSQRLSDLADLKTRGDAARSIAITDATKRLCDLAEGITSA